MAIDQHRAVWPQSRRDISDDSQRALLRAVGDGDRQAFHRLYMLNYPNVLGFALRVMNRHDRAEEIADDTMVVVWRTADRFEGRSKVSTWMFGIAYRIAMKAHKRDRKERLHVDLDAADGLADRGASDATALLDASRVNAALAALPSELRALMIMTYQYGFTVAEVADAIGCPTGTVKTRMASARRRMQAELTDGAQG